MKEPDISKAIDQAARNNARQIIDDMTKAISTALKPYWRHKLAGEEFIGDDIRRLLCMFGNSTNEWREVSYKFQPSTQMVDCCRAALVNDLLKGLPQIRLLAQMAEQNSQMAEAIVDEACPQCGNYPCSCVSVEHHDGLA